MKVKDLILKLHTMPHNAQVGFCYDGAARGGAQVVWRARSGAVLIGEARQPIYGTSDRPKGAPESEQDKYWMPRRGKEGVR